MEEKNHTLLLRWKAPSFFKTSVHFLALHYILEYFNVFFKVSEI